MNFLPTLPRPRGPLSALLIDCLQSNRSVPSDWPETSDDPLTSDDAQLALYLCYELHYRSFAGVDDRWEWDPGLLALRGRLERRFQDRLYDHVGAPVPLAASVAGAIRDLIASAEGPSLSAFMLTQGTLEQFREFAIHRSAYQLKEADPHTWAIPRVAGDTKAALVEIQADEYGGGAHDRMHSELFVTTMRELGLDPTYGAYLDLLPGTTLATVNLVSMLGLHRRWRGALIGHLALFEATSVTPMGRYSRALERLGVPEPGRRFYDVHVEADAEHEVIAIERMAAGLARDEPSLAGDIVFGTRAVLDVERRFAEAMLDRWASGRTSLLAPPLAAVA